MIVTSKDRPTYDFAKLKNKLKIHRAPINEQAYSSRWGYYRSDPVNTDFTLE